MKTQKFHLSMLTLLAGALAFMAPLVASAATASSTGCDYTSRELRKDMMSSLNPAIVGMMNCQVPFPDASVLYVARFPQLTDEALKQFVLAHAGTMDHSFDQTAIKWQSKGELGKRQIILNTITSAHNGLPASAMSHYAFVSRAQDGSYIVFVHSLMENGMIKITSTLRTIHDKMIIPASLSEILSADSKADPTSTASN